MSPSESKPSSQSTTDTNSKPPTIARIPLNLRAHILPIAIYFSIILFTGSILPLIGYFALHYTTTLKTTYILSIFTPIFGVSSIYSLITRTVRLAKKSSTCRPLGSTSAWTLDYFDWNFIFGFVVVSVIISIGISRNPSSVKITSLPLSVLLLLVCGQMVIMIPLRALGLRAPMRFSSIKRGDPLRPAVYVIVEDVVAVDGKQGDVFRAQWNARYESSAPFRMLLVRLDWLWGVSGVVVAGAVIGIIFGVEQDAVGWAVGEIPFPLPPYDSKKKKSKHTIETEKEDLAGYMWLIQINHRLVRPLDLGSVDDARHNHNDQVYMPAGKRTGTASEPLRRLSLSSKLQQKKSKKFHDRAPNQSNQICHDGERPSSQSNHAYDRSTKSLHQIPPPPPIPHTPQQTRPASRIGALEQRENIFSSSIYFSRNDSSMFACNYHYQDTHPSPFLYVRYDTKPVEFMPKTPAILAD